MAKIEGIRIKNFRGLKDITLGRVFNNPEAEPLTPMTVVIGKNGVGKSTLFDVFGFLADALKFGVEEACDKRGGFDKVRSQGETGDIEIQIVYITHNESPINYKISINTDINRVVVLSEIIFKKFNNKNIFLLYLMNGLGLSLTKNNKKDDINTEGFDIELFLNLLELLVSFEKNEIAKIDTLNNIVTEMGIEDIEIVQLTDNRKLGIATLGALKSHPEIAAFRQFIESWYLSYFTPDAARYIPPAGMQKHLNSKGDNLANVVQFMEREHRDSFQSILNRIAEKIPGINTINTYRDPITNNLYLQFNDKGFTQPFYAPQMSDGTLKVFAYLLLLEDPTPPPLICIEEPENGLYHKLLEVLAAEFRTHAIERKDGAQLFITTHQPYFVDALEPQEVWILEKGEDGFSTIRRASDDELVKNMVAEGLALGSLWYSDYLDAR